MRLFDVIKAHKNVPVDDPLAALLASSMGGWAVDTITGVPPIVFDANGTPLTDYTILGNSYQNGTPTPEDPVEVQCVGERTNNLFDKAHFNFSDSTTIVYVPIYVGEGSFTISTDLPVSASGTRDVFFINGNVSSGANSGTNGVDAAMPRTRSSVDGYVTVATRYNTSRENPADYHYMLNTGSAVLPYEPYGYKIPVTVSDGTNSQTANIYLDEPLRKKPSYVTMDELNYKTGTVMRRRRAAILTTTQYRSRSETSACFSVFGPSGAATDIGYSVVDLLCDRLKPYPNKYVALNMDSISRGWNGSFTCTLKFSTIGATPESTDAELQTLADAFFAANPTIVEYDLQTPTTETITAPAIPTINGQNTLTVDTTVQPSSVSVTGHIKPVTS